MKIIPVQVTEEIVKRSKSGETVTHVVVAAHDPSKEFLLENSPDVTVLESLEDVERHLVSNVTEAIRTLIQKAENLQREAFGESTSQVVEDSISDHSDDTPLVTLPDGSLARVHVKGYPVES
jgi:hypothetical protein